MAIPRTIAPFELVVLSANDMSWSHESMGSKEKFWVARSNTPDIPKAWLVKFSRSDTGEHWSEKLAAELATCLDVPHADVELGQYDGRLVSLSRSLLEQGQTLIHGNELLSRVDPSYPRNRNYRVHEHTLRAVVEALHFHDVKPPLSAPASITTAIGVFTGYLALDALIGNTDRHHENWAVLQSISGERQLSPSYDHASSLGREHTDQKRRDMCEDARRITHYCGKARSAFYAAEGAGSPLSCLDVFEDACRIDGSAATFWLARIDALETALLRELVWRVPEACMSRESKEFALAILLENRRRLLGVTP